MFKEMSKKERKLTIMRFAIFFIVTAIIIILSIKLLPLITKLSNEESRIEFKEQVSAMGIKGIFLMLGIQILQIVVAVIPGQPVEIISGMLYGTFGGMLLCLIGILIGTVIVFYTVRKVGLDFVQLFFSKEKIDEIKNSKIFKNTAKFETLLLIIFAIPMIPKDIFVYLGGISPIEPKRFFSIATFARIPGLILTVYAGNKLSEGSFVVTLVLFIVVMLIGAIGIYASNIAKQRLEEKS